MRLALADYINILKDYFSKMKRVIVLLSGGMDSATLLWLCKKEFEEGYSLSFDYGQRHKVELKYAKELARLAVINSTLQSG